MIIQTDDYVVDEAKRNVGITEEGVAKVEKILGVDNLYASVNTPLIQHLQNSLKAKELFKRDREYIVNDGEVQIVDEQTGRVLAGRRYSEGLHQAIEAKERVKVKAENQTLATITLQNYYRTYDKLAGMTGTAKTEEAEFLEIYELGVVEVPTNEPVVRDDQGDQIYKTEEAKFRAVAEEIKRAPRAGPAGPGRYHRRGQVRARRAAAKRMGVKHEVLNAKNHAREAHIVAQAGQVGAVTVSTNMAGRGTDIILGGNSEDLALEEVNKLDVSHLEEEEAAGREDPCLPGGPGQVRGRLRGAAREGQGARRAVRARHRASRVAPDRQPAARPLRPSGRPGASRFYLSLQDDLMRLFNASAVERS